MLNDEQLNEWQRLADEATPGPWRLRDFFALTRVVGVADMNSSENAAFIAAARTAVPALIEEVRRLTTERDEAQQWLNYFARVAGAAMGLRNVDFADGERVSPAPEHEYALFADMMKTIQERDEAKANFLAVAQAVGIVYEAEGHAVQPGPVDEIVDYIQHLKRVQCEAYDHRERLQIDPGGSDKIDELEQALLMVRAENAILRSALAAISLDEYESTSSASEKVHDHARIARRALYGEKTKT